MHRPAVISTPKNEESPLRKAVYKIDGKGRKTKLSQQAGINTAQFSTNMKYFLNRYNSATTPYIITLNDAQGKTLATLMDNKALQQRLATYQLPQKEFFQFTTSEGVKLNGQMMKPCDFSPTKKYPVLLYQYSNSGSQEVLDRYNVTWETYMASRGYVVVCVDGRGLEEEVQNLKSVLI